MSWWRWVAVGPLALVFIVVGAALVVFFVVAIPFSVAFHTLNTGGQR